MKEKQNLYAASVLLYLKDLVKAKEQEDPENSTQSREECEWFVEYNNGEFDSKGGKRLFFDGFKLTQKEAQDYFSPLLDHFNLQKLIELQTLVCSKNLGKLKNAIQLIEQLIPENFSDIALNQEYIDLLEILRKKTFCHENLIAENKQKEMIHHFIAGAFCFYVSGIAFSLQPPTSLGQILRAQHLIGKVTNVYAYLNHPDERELTLQKLFELYEEKPPLELPSLKNEKKHSKKHTHKSKNEGEPSLYDQNKGVSNLTFFTKKNEKKDINIEVINYDTPRRAKTTGHISLENETIDFSQDKKKENFFGFLKRKISGRKIKSSRTHEEHEHVLNEEDNSDTLSF